jgi:hypothetical protein
LIILVFYFAPMLSRPILALAVFLRGPHADSDALFGLVITTNRDALAEWAAAIERCARPK